MVAILRDLFWGERAYLTYWYALLLSFPFSWRNVLVDNVTGGFFNEYMDFSLYIGDGLLILALLNILYYKRGKKSMLRNNSLFHVEQSKLFFYRKMFHVEHMYLFILGIYTSLNFLMAIDKLLWIDSVITILRVVCIGVVFYVSLKVDHELTSSSTWNNRRITVFILSMSLLLQLAIGFSQYVKNESLGLGFVNESVIATHIPGVAKIVTDDGLQIRAYGTFLHPNIFGGFIAVMILIIYVLFRKQVFHVEQFYAIGLLILATIGLYITFSKSAIVSLILVSAYILFHVEQNKSYFSHTMFHVEQLYIVIPIVVLILMILAQPMSSIRQSTNERFLLAELSHSSNSHIIVGNGLGQSVLRLRLNAPDLENWLYQPVHNIYYLTLLEFGVLGVIVLIAFIRRLYRTYVPRRTNFLFLSPLILIGLIGMFDHYPVDIYVGNVLLGLAFGIFIVGCKTSKVDLTKNA